MAAVSVMSTLFSVFRPQNSQQLFFMFSDLGLYNYHNTNYTGLF